MEIVHQVYGLVCPHDNNVFYVGITVNPSRRLGNHMYDPNSAAWAYCQDLRAQGLKPKMVFFGVYEEKDKQQALALELALIKTIPHLHNRYPKME